MIPDYGGREVVSSPGQAATQFGISAPDIAHVMKILRNTLYSDKVLAVLREYGANAQDAHRDPRCPDKRGVPIRVKLPTDADPTLEIRDFGPGLTHDEVVGVFTQYGASTKRTQRDAVGYLGIGAKCGFAYGDSIVDVSSAGGLCRTYAAVLDATERGEMRLLDEEPCPEDDTGLSIQVGVRPRDVAEFRRKAASVFRFYQPRPEAGDLDLPPPVAGDCVLPGEPWLAVMGCVPYEVALSQLDVPGYARYCGGVVFFAIGELSVSASRESLEYDDRTRAALSARLPVVVRDHVRAVLGSVQGQSPWEQRLALRGMDVILPLLDAFDEQMVAVSLSLRDRVPAELRTAARTIPVDPATRVVFVDDARSPRGYAFRPADLIFRRAAQHTHAEAWDALRAMLVDLRADGVPTVRTSQMPWTRPATASKSTKHRVRSFVFLPDHRKPTKGRDALSNFWEPVDREPSNDDLYVVLDRFRTDFYDRWDVDSRIMDSFGIPRPTVYGYKAGTPRVGPRVGRRYEEWSAESLYDLAAARDPLLGDVLAALPFRRFNFWRGCTERLVDLIGVGHPVGAFAAKLLAAHKLMREYPRIDAALRLAARMGRREECAEAEAIEAAYPLLRARRDLTDLLQREGSERDWVDYFRAMDTVRAAGGER